MKYTLKYIQSLIPNSEIINCNDPESISIESICTLTQKKENALSFIGSKQFYKIAPESNAVAFVITEECRDKVTKPSIIVKNVDLAIIPVLNLFYPSEQPIGKISSLASVHPSAKIGKNTHIKDFVHIGENAKIGDHCIIEVGTVIGKNVTLGNECRIGANNVFTYDVTIGDRFITAANVSIGGDGFKFVNDKGINIKIPQVGNVIIGNDIEFGSNCCVDRGGMQDTIIGDGCKFDNHVHIAHNVVIGKNIIMAGQSGIAGSTTVGEGVIIGGGCCISDHIDLPAGTIVAGATGIRTSPKKADVYIGMEWGMPFADFQKMRVNLKHLVGFNKWAKRIETLEKKLGIEILDK